MNTITVKSPGTKVGDQWYEAGIYTPAIHAEFEGPAHYWLEPIPHHNIERLLEKGIRLGECHSPQELENAIDAAIRARGILDDPVWLPGATTEVSIIVEKHH